MNKKEQKDSERKTNKAFNTKDYKGIIVIGVKHGGDRNTIEPFIAGKSHELILAIATVMEQMPVFKVLCEQALITIASKDLTN